jgi:capsular polysaccharide biosynthesis protein
MNVTEAVARVVGRRTRLILVFLLLGLGLGWVAGSGQTTQYSATARLALDQIAPATQAQASDIADAARALATGPQLVGSVIRKLGVGRDGATVARSHVSVQSLGASGVVALSVTDRDPHVATVLANGIAAATVAAEETVTDGHYLATNDQLSSQATALRHQIDDVDARLTALGVTTGAGPSSKAAALLRTRGDLVNQLHGISDQLAQTQINHSLRARGAVLDAAAPPLARVGGHLPLYLTLGGLIGLLVGVGLAAAMESIRPTLVGRAAIGRRVDAPVLLELDGSPQTWTSDAAAAAAMHIELASVPAKVTSVALVTVGDKEPDGMRAFATLLDESLPSLDVSYLGLRSGLLKQGRRDDDNGHAAAWKPSAEPRTGLLIVVPNAVLQDDVDRAHELVAITGWPLLGVLVYRPAAMHTTVRRGRRQSDRMTQSHAM